MSFEQGGGLGDIRPFGKTLTPPEVILGCRVKLGEVEGDQPWCRLAIFRQICLSIHFLVF